MICVGVNHSVNRHQLMYKRKRHPEVEASQMPYSYQVAGPATKPNKQKKIKDSIWLKINGK